MLGINLNAPIKYLHASFRYFKKNEFHIKRICNDNVLLLVFDGILRFQENGKDYEIKAGQYHIQKQNSFQEGVIKSDKPKYLYVHFLGEECEEEKGTLTLDGQFDINKFMPFMEKLDELAHSDATYVSQASTFYQILSLLGETEKKENFAGKIGRYIEKNYFKPITLNDIQKEFSFSKNHLINIFKKEYGITPIEYLKKVRINNAIRKMEATSETLEKIAYLCGFNDYPYFYKVFKNETGISPVAWRKKSRGNI